MTVGSKIVTARCRAGVEARSREGLSGEWLVDSTRPHEKLSAVGIVSLLASKVLPLSVSRVQDPNTEP